MNIKEYPLTLISGVTERQDIDAVGETVRCIESANQFLLEIDGGQPVKFWTGRKLRIPGGFNKLTVRFDILAPLGIITPHPIKLVVSSGVRDGDARIDLYDSARIREQGAASVVSVNYTHGGALGVNSFNATSAGLASNANVFRAMVRNTGALTFHIASNDTAGLAGLNAGGGTAGIIVEPGETVEISSVGSIAGKFPTGATCVVTWFSW